MKYLPHFCYNYPKINRSPRVKNYCNRLLVLLHRSILTSKQEVPISIIANVKILKDDIAIQEKHVLENSNVFFSAPAWYHAKILIEVSRRISLFTSASKPTFSANLSHQNNILYILNVSSSKAKCLNVRIREAACPKSCASLFVNHHNLKHFDNY